MLRLDQLAQESVVETPYPHIACQNALENVAKLNADFPSKEQFGPTIRMDGDLTSGDSEYERLISRSHAYYALHQQIYSRAFVEAFLKLFRTQTLEAYRQGELLLDPFNLDIVSEPLEKRVSGRSFVARPEPVLYARFDIGYGGVGYGVHNGGSGIHVDNLPRLVSVLIYLNTPTSMVGGAHRLYALRGSEPVLARTFHPTAGLLIASLQSNRAFHDVEPITEIEGQRRAFYMAVSCSEPIWKKEVDAKLCALSKNRYDPPPPSILSKLRRLLPRRRYV